jgi:hypothetical protein
MGTERHFFEFSNDDIQELQNLLQETNHIFDPEPLANTPTTATIPLTSTERVTIKKTKRRMDSEDSISSNSTSHSTVSNKSNLKESPQIYTINNNNNNHYDFISVKYVVSFYLLEENTYGIEKIILFSKHEPNHYNPQQVCSERQAHFHYIIKFNRCYYETKLRENQPLFPVLSEIKVITIENIKQYNDCITFISTLKQMSNFSNNTNTKETISVENLINHAKVINNNNNNNNSNHKRKHGDEEECSYDEEKTSCSSTCSTSCDDETSSSKSKNDDHSEITLDDLNRLKEKAKLSDSIKLMEEYLTNLDRFNKQEEIKKTFHEIIEKEKPINDYEYEVLR